MLAPTRPDSPQLSIDADSLSVMVETVAGLPADPRPVSRVHYLAVVVGHFDYKLYVYSQVTPGTWYCAHVHDNENTTEAAKELLYRLDNASPHDSIPNVSVVCSNILEVNWPEPWSANNNMTLKKAINELKKFDHKFGALLATPNAWPNAWPE